MKKHYAGVYERSSDLNGKPTFKMENKAIWWVQEGYWVISTIEDFGKPSGWIYSQSQHGLTDSRNTWFHFVYDNDEWTTLEAGLNDFDFTCRQKPSKYLGQSSLGQLALDT